MVPLSSIAGLRLSLIPIFFQLSPFESAREPDHFVVVLYLFILSHRHHALSHKHIITHFGNQYLHDAVLGSSRSLTTRTIRLLSLLRRFASLYIMES